MQCLGGLAVWRWFWHGGGVGSSPTPGEFHLHYVRPLTATVGVLFTLRSKTRDTGSTPVWDNFVLFWSKKMYLSGYPPPFCFWSKRNLSNPWNFFLENLLGDQLIPDSVLGIQIWNLRKENYFGWWPNKVLVLHGINFDRNGPLLLQSEIQIIVVRFELQFTESDKKKTFKGTSQKLKRL